MHTSWEAWKYKVYIVWLRIIYNFFKETDSTYTETDITGFVLWSWVLLLFTGRTRNNFYVLHWLRAVFSRTSTFNQLHKLIWVAWWININSGYMLRHFSLIKVEARETQPPNHVVMANVNITLLDENDNSPKFTSNKYSSKVFTNQTEGMLLVKVRSLCRTVCPPNIETFTDCCISL